MSDTNSFERRLTTELEHIAGPRRPVDVRAVRQAAKASSGRPRRWWSLPRTTTDMPTTNQHLQVQTGRTRTMFSATKLVAGAAVLALAGGLLYSGVVTVEPDQPVPAGAEAERTDFIIVTGTSTLSSGGAPSGADTMSDPRVSGPVRLTNKFAHGSEDSTGVQWGEYTLTNEDGGWEGEWVGFWDPYGPDYPDVVGMENAMTWARGTGDYEGWSYVANYTGALDSLDVRGLLFQDDIPPTVALGLLEAEAE